MAKHTPPDDNSFSLSLLRHLAAAVALVAVVAAAFWGVGQVKDDGIGTIAAGPDGTTTEEAPATDAADPTAPASEAPPADEGTATAEPTDRATTPEPELTATPTETGTEEQAAVAEFDPADISVQVLDATGEGGAKGDEVAEQLREDGFQVVATNQAVRVYEVTTVFYTPGNEAKAEQLAATYGYDEVEPEPGNLSHSVDVHLVVGTDA